MADNEITIRAVEVSDAAVIAQIWLRCTAEVAAHEPIYTPAIDVEDLTHRLGAEFSSGQKFGWVAEVGNELVGYVTCSVQEEEPIFVERRYVYVADLDVTPAYRGQGLSRALMNQVEQDAQARGIRRLELAVAYGDPRSRAVWERHGFRAHFLHLHKDL